MKVLPMYRAVKILEVDSVNVGEVTYVTVGKESNAEGDP